MSMLIAPARAQEAEVVALPRIIVKRWPGAGVDVLVNKSNRSAIEKNPKIPKTPLRARRRQRWWRCRGSS